MGSIREALLRNGVYYFNYGGTNYTIQDGAGNYMVACDPSGRVRYRIEASELTQNLVVRDVDNWSVVQTIGPSIL